MMYGLGSTPGQRAPETGDAGADQHGAEPQRHARVEAALEQIEGERTGRDEEHEDPDRPVIEPVIELVALADLAVGGVFDGDGDCQMISGSGDRRAKYTGVSRRRQALTVPVGGQLSQGDSGGNRHVQRIDVRGDRNADPDVGHHLGFRA